MKVYILFYHTSIEAGSGYEDLLTVQDVFYSQEEAQREAGEKNSSMSKWQRDYSWYEVKEFEVK